MINSYEKEFLKRATEKLTLEEESCKQGDKTRQELIDHCSANLEYDVTQDEYPSGRTRVVISLNLPYLKKSQPYGAGHYTIAPPIDFFTDIYDFEIGVNKHDFRDFGNVEQIFYYWLKTLC